VRGAANAVGPSVEALAEHFGMSQGLLVFDNFEQVLSAGVTVAELLRAAPGMRAIVTSRAPLRIRGERVFSLAPLRAEPSDDGAALESPSQFPALALFAQRAADSGRTLAADDVPAASRICARVDGLPLAIELAAAHVRVLGPDELLRQLEERLPRLSDGPRDLPERHSTLEAAIAWSHDLLPADERTVFARLSVLAGSFDSDAATAVASTGDEQSAASALDGLVEQSLLVRTNVGQAAGERYRMLETIREFAGHQLTPPQTDELFGTALAYWLGVAQDAEGELHGEGQAAWVPRLDSDLDSIRMVLAWAAGSGTADRVEAAIRIVAGMRRYWDFTGRSIEARTRLATLLEAGGAVLDQRVRSDALSQVATSHLVAGEHRQAEPFLLEALKLRTEIGDPVLIAATKSNLAVARRYAGDLAGMEALMTEAVELSRSAGDVWGTAAGLGNLAISAIDQGNLDAATRWFEQALAEFTKLGDAASIAMVTDGLGLIALAQGRLPEANRLLSRAIEVAEDAGDASTVLTGRLNLARLNLRTADAPDARQHVSACLESAVELHETFKILEALELKSELLVREGRHAEAAVLLGATQGRRDREDWAVTTLDRVSWRDATLRELRAQLGEDGLMRRMTDGASLDYERVLEAQRTGMD